MPSIIKDPVFIGANLVEFTKGQDPRSGFKKYYQLRFICKIKEMHELMPDPDDGKINERYFIKAEEIPHYVKWGKVGDLMFRQGISKAKELGWLS